MQFMAVRQWSRVLVCYELHRIYEDENIVRVELPETGVIQVQELAEKMQASTASHVEKHCIYNNNALTLFVRSKQGT
jgi:hypothetical protein